MTLFSRFLALVLCLAAVPAPAHEGHDHGEAPAAPVQALPRVEARSESFELVAVASGRRLTVYLADYRTNAPVPEATLEVSLDGNAISARRKAAGVHEIAADWVAAPGSKALVFTVATPSVSDLLSGVLEIPQPAAAAASPAASFADLARSRLVWIWTALAGATGFVLALAFRRRPLAPATAARASDATEPGRERRAASILSLGGLALAVTLSLTPSASAEPPAHEHGSEGEALIGIDVARRLPDGAVFMPKPAQWLLGVRTAITEMASAARAVELLGTVVPDPSASGRVQASVPGRVEVADGRLPHVGQRVAKGEAMAILSPTVPVFDRGTADAQIAEIAGAIVLAEQKVRRYAGLAGIVPQKDIDQVNAELEALKARRAALRPVGGPETLKAPVSGIVSAASVHLGQVVDARETLFEIVDPEKLWIEAIGTEQHEAGAILSAAAVVAGETVPLSFIGRGPALKQQAQPLLFRVQRPSPALAVGRPVTVLVQSKQQLSGILVPASAVVRAGNGLPQVWEMAGAERFEAIAVRTAPVDGKNVLITAGVKEGTRLVVEGAEFVNQVR
jgi:hypothetical protein